MYCQSKPKKEKYISDSILIQSIAVTVYLFIVNQKKFRLLHNENENCQYDHINFNQKGIGDLLIRM